MHINNDYEWINFIQLMCEGFLGEYCKLMAGKVNCGFLKHEWYIFNLY